MTEKPTADNYEAALPDLRIVIVGAGIGGLAAGVACKRAGFKNVKILENAAEISEGIQVAPNFSRLLRRWDLLDKLRPLAVPLETISIRRYKNNEELTKTAMMPMAEDTYGAPLWVAHRSDLQRCLLGGAIENGVEISMNSFVDKVDFKGSKVHVKQTDEWVTGDVILAADGVKSIIRGYLLADDGATDSVRATGDSAWRVTLKREQLEHDPELLELIDGNVGIRWMGPGGHIMAYPVRSNELYNIVFLHPSRTDMDESWTHVGSKSEMLEFSEGWNPTVKKLLSLVADDKLLDWKLFDRDPLPKWVLGNFALMGDAVHPMLPYVAQGAAQAAEDGATLSAVLSQIEKPDEINIALKIYEHIRKERAEAIQASAVKNREALHYPDGPEQEQRDEKMRLSNAGGSNPDLWGDREWQRYMWGVDSQQQVFDDWERLYGQLK